MPRRTIAHFFAAAVCAVLATSASAATITGTVTNGTNHTPAAGDTVVLIALDQRMQEIARSKTDTHVQFCIDSCFDCL